MTGKLLFRVQGLGSRDRVEALHFYDGDPYEL